MATKWLVSLVAAIVLFMRRDAAVLALLLGAAANGVLCKLLKAALRSPRPDAATEMDGGMPSSHASSATYLALSAAELTRNPAARGAALLGGLLVAESRVRNGQHTWPQVAAGAAVGAATQRAVWAAIGAQPWLTETVPLGACAVVAASAAAVVGAKDIARLVGAG